MGTLKFVNSVWYEIVHVAIENEGAFLYSEQSRTVRLIRTRFGECISLMQTDRKIRTGSQTNPNNQKPLFGSFELVFMNKKPRHANENPNMSFLYSEPGSPRVCYGRTKRTLVWNKETHPEYQQLFLSKNNFYTKYTLQCQFNLHKLNTRIYLWSSMHV